MEENPKSKFDLAIDNFITNIESLHSSLPSILKQLKNLNKEAVKKHDDFLKNKCEYKSEIKKYYIDTANYWKFKPLNNSMQNSETAIILINRSFIISLLSQLDTYLKDLMEIIIDNKPHIITGSDKKLTFSEIAQFENLDEAKEHLIEKEIETVIRNNINEQFKWFENNLSVKLRKDLPSWNTLMELTQRRNLFVHNNGKVSTQYLKNCSPNTGSQIKLNDTLHSDLDYFEQSFNCLFEIAVKLNQVIRRKLLPEELNTADRSFINITFELILKQQFRLAESLFDFSSKYLRFTSTDYELRVKLNKAQTQKWLGNQDECYKIIQSLDFSATDEIYKLASYVLLNEFDKAATSMISIGNNPSKLNKEHYFDWPIFKEFIKTKEFKNAFKNIYGETELLELNKNAK